MSSRTFRKSGDGWGQWRWPLSWHSLCAALLGPRSQAQGQARKQISRGQNAQIQDGLPRHQSGLTIAGMQESRRSQLKHVIVSQTVGKKRDDSCLPVEQKIDSLKIDLSLSRRALPSTLTRLTRTSRSTTRNSSFLAEVFKPSAEATYTVVLDKEYKVKAIEGSEKLLEKADKLSPIKPKTRSAAGSSPTC